MPDAPQRRDRKRIPGGTQDRRLPASQRGYDSDWNRLRAAHVARQPLCVRCAEQVRAVPVAEVDHIRPFCGKADPLRLDPQNLQSLCRSCHAIKTAEDVRTLAI